MSFKPQIAKNFQRFCFDFENTRIFVMIFAKQNDKHGSEHDIILVS